MNESQFEDTQTDEAQPETAAADGAEKTEEAAGAEATTHRPEQPKPKTKMQVFLQLLIFTAFMASAGVIQFVTTGLLSTWTGLMKSESDNYYWCAYLAGLVLSVIWSFTFNRKFTFKSASNLPLAMGLVILYYCAFAPLSTFGADAIIDAWKNAAGDGWTDNYEMVITAGMMLINFVTEFFWEKFVVFNDKVIARLEKKLRIGTKRKSAEESGEAPAKETAQAEDGNEADKAEQSSLKDETN